MIHYCITDPKYYGTTPEALQNTLQSVLAHSAVDFICLRDKSTQNLDALAHVFSKTVKGKKSFINSHIDLAVKYHFDGVHLTSQQFHEIKKAKKLALEVIVSTHTHDEIVNAIHEGADYVTYSPIYATPNKGIPKGLEDLKETIAKIPAKIIALGGITTKEHVNSIAMTHAYGFASIRYFIK